MKDLENRINELEAKVAMLVEELDLKANAADVDNIESVLSQHLSHRQEVED